MKNSKRALLSFAAIFLLGIGALCVLLKPEEKTGEGSLDAGLAEKVAPEFKGVKIDDEIITLEEIIEPIKDKLEAMDENKKKRAVKNAVDSHVNTLLVYRAALQEGIADGDKLKVAYDYACKRSGSKEFDAAAFEELQKIISNERKAHKIEYKL